MTKDDRLGLIMFAGIALLYTGLYWLNKDEIQSRKRFMETCMHHYSENACARSFRNGKSPTEEGYAN